jgi:hypothetical protein
MKRTITVLCMAALGLAIFACDKKDDAAAGGGGGGGGGGSVGVAECDQYISKMEACIGKMDSAAKAAAEPGFKQMRDTWKQTAAQGGAAKDGLKTGCKAALDAMPPNCK